MILVALFIMAIGSLMMLFSVLNIYTIYVYNSWDALETTSIENVDTEETVRIDGFIDEPYDDIAIGGEEVHRKGAKWEWNITRFWLSDSTGSIRVTTVYQFRIEDGPHPAPNRIETEGTCYKGGDNVTVIGIVKEIDGELLLYLRWIGTDPEDIRPTSNLYYLTLGFLLGPLVPLVPLGIWGLMRRLIHNDKMKLESEKDNWRNEKSSISDDEIEWKNNGKWRRGTVRKIIGSIYLLWFSFYVISFILGEMPTREYFFLMTIGSGLILIFSIIKGAYFYFNTFWIWPCAVGTSEKGIHFDFKDEPTQRVKLDFIPWKDIDSFSKPGKQYKNWWRSILFKDGTHFNISGIHLSVVPQLEKEFQRVVTNLTVKY